MQINTKITVVPAVLAVLASAVAIAACSDDESETTSTASSTGSGAAGSGGGTSSSTTTSSSTGEGGGSGGATGSGGMGGGSTTPDCDAYCAAVMANCTGETAQYEDDATCAATCGFWELGRTVDFDASGNTVACHQYWAQESVDAETCATAGPGGQMICGATLFDNFCELALQVCPAVFADVNECLTTAMTWPGDPPYSANKTTGNSRQCRLVHLVLATVDPAECDNISNTGACQ